MKLSRSAWKKTPSEGRDDHYIIILPEQDAIVNFTSMQDESERWVIWGCRMREEEDSVVFTALRNATKWRRETYHHVDGLLHWNTESGHSVWARISEKEIPELLRERGEKFLIKLRDSLPPEIQTPDKVAEAND